MLLVNRSPALGIILASLNGSVGTGELFIYTSAAGDEGAFEMKRPSLVSSGAPIFSFACQEHDK